MAEELRQVCAKHPSLMYFFLWFPERDGRCNLQLPADYLNVALRDLPLEPRTLAILEVHNFMTLGSLSQIDPVQALEKGRHGGLVRMGPSVLEKLAAFLRTLEQAIPEIAAEIQAGRRDLVQDLDASFQLLTPPLQSLINELVRAQHPKDMALVLHPKPGWTVSSIHRHDARRLISTIWSRSLPTVVWKVVLAACPLIDLESLRGLSPASPARYPAMLYHFVLQQTFPRLRRRDIGSNVEQQG